MDNITSFLDSFFDQIRFVKLDIDGLVLDHVAFQSSSAADYDSKMEEFK